MYFPDEIRNWTVPREKEGGRDMRTQRSWFRKNRVAF